MRHTQQIERHADGHDVQCAEALDQVTGEERRCEHADDMPFQHEGCVIKTQTTLLHGQRCGCHQQVHDSSSPWRRSRQATTNAGCCAISLRGRPIEVAAFGAWCAGKRMNAISTMRQQPHAGQHQVGTRERHLP